MDIPWGVGGLVVGWVLVSAVVALLCGLFLAGAHRKERMLALRPGEPKVAQRPQLRTARNRVSQYFRKRLRRPA